MHRNFSSRSRGRGNSNGFQPSSFSTRPPCDPVFKMNISRELDEFMQSGLLYHSFEPMDRLKRKVVHDLARSLRLHTKSDGVEPNRRITVSIRNPPLTRAFGASTDPIVLHERTATVLHDYVTQNPIDEDEIADYLKEKSNNGLLRDKRSTTASAKVPPLARYSNADLLRKRQALPSFKYRQRLIDALRKNNVTIVSGGTGCGKTTQVPQFILEEAAARNEKVRIMCTQPRRIAAISISERVARERGERVGETVGYHIRLEQKTSEKTILTYCTSGVLLRMLSTNPTAEGITHIILDEIHERETNTDYLLIALKQALGKRRDLKIVLMSATIEGNMNLFESYFNEKFVDVIRIESKLFDVHKLFLGDILAMIGYDPPDTLFGCYQSSDPTDDFPSMGVWQDPQQPQGWSAPPAPMGPPAVMNQNYAGFGPSYIYPQNSFRQVKTEPVLEDVWERKGAFGSQRQQPADSQANRMYNGYSNPNQWTNEQGTSKSNGNSCVTNSAGEWISGPYLLEDGDEISESKMNAFEAAMGGLDVRPVVCSPAKMAAEKPTGPVQQGFGNMIQPSSSGTMLAHSTGFGTPAGFGNQAASARPSFYVPTPTSSVAAVRSDSASGLGKFGDSEVFGASMARGKELERRYRADFKNALPNRPMHFEKDVLRRLQNANVAAMNLEAKYLACGGSQYEDSIDWDLVNEVVKYLADSPIFGSILVFLPGFEDISQVRQKIDEWKFGLKNYSQVNVLCLHSQMNSIDQNEVFNTVPKNVRKIILSTNIAEASVTIEDVIFVVDTGKVKEKVFRHETKFSTLKVTTIAKSNAEQRAGRAGRVTDGYCFRLYGTREYNAMPETQLAEMQRVAIYDVCLHAKLFAPRGMRVSEFLQMAPEPPTPLTIEQSMEFLEQLGALYSESKTSNELPEGDYDETQDPELTDLGRIMAQMPLDPQLARLLIFGLALKCLNPVLNLVALLSYRDPFLITSSNDRELQNKIRDKIARRDFSDHLLYIRLVDEFARCSQNQQAGMRFCHENFLNFNTMRMIVGVRRQLLTELKRAKLIDHDKDVMFAITNIEYNKYSQCWGMVQAAIAAGCYPCVGVSTGNSNKLRKVQTHADSKSTLHPSSVVKRQSNTKADSHDREPQLQFVVYQELSMIEGGLALRGVTVTPAACILLLTGPLRLKHSIICDYDLAQEAENARRFENAGTVSHFNSGFESFEIEPWYAVRGMKPIIRNLLRLRFKFMHHFLKALHNPVLFGTPNPHITKMLDTLNTVLTNEIVRCRFGRPEMPRVENLREYPPPPALPHYSSAPGALRDMPNQDARLSPSMSGGPYQQNPNGYQYQQYHPQNQNQGQGYYKNLSQQPHQPQPQTMPTSTMNFRNYSQAPQYYLQTSSAEPFNQQQLFQDVTAKQNHNQTQKQKPLRPSEEQKPLKDEPASSSSWRFGDSRRQDSGSYWRKSYEKEEETDDDDWTPKWGNTNRILRGGHRGGRGGADRGGRWRNSVEGSSNGEATNRRANFDARSSRDSESDRNGSRYPTQNPYLLAATSLGENFGNSSSGFGRGRPMGFGIVGDDDDEEGIEYEAPKARVVNKPVEVVEYGTRKERGGRVHRYRSSERAHEASSSTSVANSNGPSSRQKNGTNYQRGRNFGERRTRGAARRSNGSERDGSIRGARNQ